jgi:hypothetical protein
MEDPLAPRSSARFPFLTGFESFAYMPELDRHVDVLETTEHDLRFADDLRLVREVGISVLGYPAPWHRLEPAEDAKEGIYNWG